MFYGDEAVDAAEFARRVATAAQRNPQTEVQLRADILELFYPRVEGDHGNVGGPARLDR